MKNLDEEKEYKKDSDRFCSIHSVKMEPDDVLGDLFYSCSQCEEEKQRLEEEKKKIRKLEVEKIKDENECKRMERDYESVMERFRVSNLKFRRKLSRGKSSITLAIPPILIEHMDALDCEEVFLTLQDRDHIVIELIRHSLPIKETEDRVKEEV